MGREVRRVPLNWEHPKDNNGDYIPLFDREYHAAAREWIDNLMAWERGERPEGAADCCYYWEWTGAPPEPDYDGGTYRIRAWTPEEAVGFQLYETTTEGTPLSPIFASLDEVCVWAAEHATTFADWTATVDEWRQMLGAGFVHHREGNAIFL